MQMLQMCLKQRRYILKFHLVWHESLSCSGFSYSLAVTIRHHVAKHCAPWLTFKGEFVTAPLV
jgi:hypothetical protein